MNEEEFLRRTLNKIAKEFGYDVASTLELMFIKREKQLDQYKNNWKELKKWVKDISYIEGNDDFCNGFNRAICGMREDILNKMKELEEKNND